MDCWQGPRAGGREGASARHALTSPPRPMHRPASLPLRPRNAKLRRPNRDVATGFHMAMCPGAQPRLLRSMPPTPACRAPRLSSCCPLCPPARSLSSQTEHHVAVTPPACALVSLSPAEVSPRCCCCFALAPSCDHASACWPKAQESRPETPVSLCLSCSNAQLLTRTKLSCRQLCTGHTDARVDAMHLHGIHS